MSLITLAVTAIGLVQAQAQPGTPIKLMLLTKLESGKVKVGREVPFAVVSDVTGPDGQVRIKQGTIVFGKVTASRAEGPLSAAVLDRPARLALRVDGIELEGGTTIPICFDLEKPDAELQLTREGTTPEQEGEEIAKLLRDPENKPLLESLVRAMDDGRLDFRDAQAVALTKFLSGAGLHRTAEVIQTGRLTQLTAFFAAVFSPDIGRMNLSGGLGNVGLALEVIQEVGGLYRRSAHFLKGRFKGRNIRAYPGWTCTAYVAGSKGG